MSNVFQLVWLIPVLPLLGFLINGLGRKLVSKTMAGVIGSGTVLASFIISLLIFIQLNAGDIPKVPFHYFDFINITALKIGFDFQIDQLTSIFLLIITGVGFLIHVYSTSYMHDEEPKDFAKYFAYLNLFVFSMLLLVMGANYVIMFIGWEGVGLCSYLLIGFWFKNTNYNVAAKKAFIMNRIGDLGFLLAVFWLISKLGTADYHEVFANVSNLTTTDITAITMLLFVGAMGKSAQIPLYTWLPDAMAGPTPVSALIHAATMVTAGIYMIARSNILYTMSPVTQAVVAIVGLSTAILAATIALKQNDIKKVLAYSTVSQLGYMFLALGVGAYTGAVFHVMTHAFFKALLFLGAGSVIHAMGGEQDIRNIGCLKKYMSVTHITFLLACLAIAGMPPFSGFFSKDEILAAAYNSNGKGGVVLWGLGVLTAIMTAFYMFRLYAMTFLGKFRGTHEQEHHLHESPKAMTIPLIILAILSVIGGWIGIPEVFMHGGHRLEAFLEPVFAQSNALTEKVPLSHATEYMLMGISVAAALAALVFAWNKFSKYQKTDVEETGLGKALANKWYVDELYDAIIVKPVQSIAKYFSNVFEKKGIDGFVNGVGKAVNYGSRQIRLLQTGQVGTYVLMMVLGILIFFIIQLFL